jgi:hydroxyacylglutathione hydrolase
MFNTPYEDMTVNSYLVWDGSRARPPHSTRARLRWHARPRARREPAIGYVLLTHTHEDHVADLPRLIAETGAEVWASEREPAGVPGAKTFKRTPTSTSARSP